MRRFRPRPFHLRSLAIGLISFLLCTCDAAAQGVSKGVRGGINLANLAFEGNDPASLDMTIRFVFGGYVTLPLTSWLDLQPEVLYTMKGAESSENGIDSKVMLDYVEIPVLARLSRRGSGLHYYLAAGPSFAVRVRAKTRSEFSGATEEIDIGDKVERLDLGLSAGGGVELGSMVVDGRSTFGLSDTDKDKSDDVKMRNRVISLSVGFRF